MSQGKANGMLWLAAIIWGSGYIFSKLATNSGMQAGTINAIRGFIFMTLAYLFFHRAIRQMTRTDFAVGLVAGTLNFIAYQLQTVGLMYTTPANNAFLTAIYVVLIPFIYWVFTRQRPDRRSFIAIVVCLVGMAVLTGVVQAGFRLHIGDLLTVIAAGFYGASIAYFGMAATKANPWVTAFMLGATQGGFGLVWALLFERGSWSGTDWGGRVVARDCAGDPLLFCWANPADCRAALYQPDASRIDSDDRSVLRQPILRDVGF